MKIKSALFLFITIIAFVLNCNKRDNTYTIEIKEGVNYVHNLAPAWGDTLKIALEFVQKIGELDMEDENFQLYRPRDIVRDADENIYVLDAGNYRIQKYDKNGKYMATIGRKGEGPGEFLFPNSIAIDSKGNLYVDEMFQASIKSFNK